MITKIRSGFFDHEPARLSNEHDSRAHAGVLVPVIDRNDARLILTERAGSLNTHGGEVAFPGGKQDDTDISIEMTALRETDEEIGIGSDAIEVVGALRPFISKYGLVVTPLVGVVRPGTPYVPNPDEIASIFEVPLSFFLHSTPARFDEIVRHGESHSVPAWDFEGYEIWGLTSMIIAEFLKVVDV